MKVQQPPAVEPRHERTARKFAEVFRRLSGARTPPSGSEPSQAPRSSVSAPALRTPSHAAPGVTAQAQREARAQMHAKAATLVAERSEALNRGEQKVDARVLELIVHELSAEMGLPLASSDDSPTVPLTRAEINAVLGGPAHEQAVPELPQVSDLRALVERIRVFVKNDRPALALSVTGGLNAEVEIERAGPKLVSLRITGRGGLPRTQEINSLKEALAAKGIRVSMIEVAMGAPARRAG